MDLLARLLAALRAGYLALVSALTRGGRAVAHGTARGARGIGRAVSPVVPAQWKQRIALLFVTGLAFVPIIYSGNMTWSFNDPSGHLSQITAAVVNEDRGGTTETADGTEKHVDVGAEFTDTLLDMDKSTVYRFVQTDRATADAGLHDGTYGAVVEIPADFSEKIASMGGDPAQAAPALLTVRTNDTVNYVGGNFTKSVGTALKESLSANVLDQYLDNVYIGFTTIHDNIVTAADGAGQLADGSTQLHSGTSQLRDGSATLAAGSKQLDAGAYQLVVGLNQIDAGAAQLADGATQLDAGANTLASGLHTLDANSDQLRQGAGQLADGTDQLDEGAATLADGAGQVADGTQQLDDKVTLAQQKAQELGIDQDSVDRATADLQTAIDDLTGAATALNDAIDGPGQTPRTIADAARLRAPAAADVATKAEALRDALQGAQQDAGAVSTDAGTLSQQLTPLTQAVATASGASQTHADHASALSTATTDYTQKLDDLAASCTSSPSDGGGSSDLCAQLQELSGDSAGLRSDAATVSTEAADQNAALTTAAGANTDVSATLSDLTTHADDLAGILAGSSAAGDLVTPAQDLATLARRHATDAAQTADDAEKLADAIEAAQQENGGRIISREDVQQRIDALSGQATVAVQTLPSVYDRADQAVDAVHRLNQGAQQVSQGATRLSGATGQLSTGARTLQQGIGQYTDGVGTAASGSDTLVDGADQLADGATTLAGATGQAAAGAVQLHDGTSQAVAGTAQLADGAVQVDDGAAQLVDGSTQLSDGLHEAEDQVPAYTDSEREHLASTASDPVGLNFHRDNGLDRFGEGLAPLFLSISLWVGGMSIFLMMPPFAEAALRRGTNALGLLLGGLLPAQVLGLVQTIIAVGVLHLAVGVSAHDLPLLFGMACLTSVVFVALNHGFGAIAGPVGKFIALVLIAMQISGAGGTYPTGTLPGFFRAIHPYLPMTHSVNAFRGAIGGGWIDPTGDVLWLLAWLMVGLACGLGGAFIQRRKAQRDMSGAIPASA